LFREIQCCNASAWRSCSCCPVSGAMSKETCSTWSGPPLAAPSESSTVPPPTSPNANVPTEKRDVPAPTDAPAPKAPRLPTPLMEEFSHEASAQNDGTGGTCEEEYRAPLSPRLEEGHSSMANMINSNLAGILKPITDHIMDLQQDLQRLSIDMNSVQSFVDRGGAKLKEHSLQIFNVEAEVHQNLAQRGWCVAEFEQLHAKHASLHDAHGETRVLADGAVTRCQALDRITEDLQKSIERLDLIASELKADLDEQRVRKAEQTTVVELQNMYEGMNSRQLGLVQTVESNRTASEKSQKALSILTFEKKSQEKELWKSVAALKDGFHGLDSRLGQTETDVLVRGKMVDDMKLTLDDHMEMLDGLENDVRATEQEQEKLKKARDVQGQEQEAAHNQRTKLATVINDKFNLLKEITNEIQDKLDQSNEEVARLGTKEVTMSAAFNRNAEDILTFGQTQRHQSQQIAQSKQDLEEYQAKQSTEAAERAARHAEHRQTVNKNHVGLSGKIEAHSKELKAHEEKHSETEKSLNVTKSHLRKTDANVESTQSNLLGVTLRLDLAHEYFRGLSKGFEDTHRRVQNGEDGFLSPKSSPGKMLPVLPKPGR